MGLRVSEVANLKPGNINLVNQKLRVVEGKGKKDRDLIIPLSVIDTLKEWKKIAEKLSKLPFSQADARGFGRLMLVGAREVNIDSLGRILIPDYLKKYSGLNKKVVVAGVYDRVEIWDNKKWDEYKAKTEAGMGDMAERLGELGI